MRARARRGFARARAGSRRLTGGAHGLLSSRVMANKVRINLANEQELMELPGIGRTQAAAIVRHRSQHGPIEGPEALATVLGGGPLADSTRSRADFSPASPTAPEAPGA